MTDKKQILFVNDEMQMGGVARVLNTLMAALPEEKYEIDLLILHKEGMLLKEIPSRVHVIEGSAFFREVDQSLELLWQQRKFKDLAGKLRLLTYMKTGLIKNKIRSERKKILTKQYDVEIAAKEGFCTIFTAYGDSKRKINWVLTDYSVCNYSRNHMPLVQEALKHIDLNIADSEKALIAYETVFHVSNGITIHNLMDTERIKEALKEDDGSEINGTDGPNIITVARFHPQKSIDRLLMASHETYLSGNHHTLYLIGGGEEEDKLRTMVKEMNMNNVVFLGYRQNPYADMAKADLYVSSSLYEGFATVISESLIVGTPVLATEVSGAREQITAPEQGWVVENSQEALTEGLKTALCSIGDLHDMKYFLKGYEYPNEALLNKFMEAFEG